jgi:uncharacterized protein (DUF4415 family)
MDSDPEDALTAKPHHFSNGRNVKEEIAYGRFIDELAEFEIVRRHIELTLDQVPPGWHSIEKDIPVRPRKTKVTAAFDTEVVKWFRAMGLGYQARMNQVLRTYMLAIMSRHIDRDRNRDWKGDLLRGRR